MLRINTILYLFASLCLLYVNCEDEPGVTEKEQVQPKTVTTEPEPANEHTKPVKKVSVTEISFDSLVDDLVWCGPDHTTVLLKTSSGRLYRSTNSGKQWNEVTNLLSGTTRSESFHVDSLMVCETDKNVLVVLGDGNLHFISSDAGKNFRPLGFTGPVNMWTFHPTKASWALLSTWEGNCLSTNSGEDCTHSLFITKDLGRTFSRVSRYVAQFSWGDVQHKSEDRIYFSRYHMESGDQPKQDGWNDSISFRYTDDFGETTHVLVKGGNKFLISGGYIFVAQVIDTARQTVNLFVSTDNGLTFNKAILPTELEERSYTILDTSEGAVIIHVSHTYEGNDVEVGNVYISDASGLKYTLSLPNNIRAASGECEFDKVYSLEGVYIANFRDDSGGILNPKDKFKSPSGNMTQIDKKKKGGHHNKVEQNIRTVISFNKGAEWNYLTPPKLDSNGRAYNCDQGKCFLHLHGITQFRNFAPFYSVENAVGLVLATGNVGDRLSFEPSEVNTFLSRDGGLTWTEVHKGAFIYEFGDHGGLIVMAEDQRKTREVVFSWNEGANWFDFSLSKHELSVNNVVIEPTASSLEFLLYGNRNGIGVIFHLDFAALGQPPCKGIWAIDSSSSDYETWTPTDKLGNECLLGKKVTYKRRKQSSECFNGKDFKKSIDRQVCSCTRQDYECEVGFTRSVGSDVCKIDGTYLMREGCTSSSFFYTNAYRKVPGDVCVGGWIPELVAVPCPPHSPLSKGSKAVLTFILLLAFVMMTVVYISQNERLKHVFHNYGFKTYEYVPYSPLNSKNSQKGAYNLGGRFEPELGFIDAEQEHEEAPTLLNYLGDNSHSTSSHRNGQKNDNKTIELL